MHNGAEDHTENFKLTKSLTEKVEKLEGESELHAQRMDGHERWQSGHIESHIETKKPNPQEKHKISEATMEFTIDALKRERDEYRQALQNFAAIASRVLADNYEVNL